MNKEKVSLDLTNESEKFLHNILTEDITDRSNEKCKLTQHQFKMFARDLNAQLTLYNAYYVRFPKNDYEQYVYQIDNGLTKAKLYLEYKHSPEVLFNPKLLESRHTENFTYIKDVDISHISGTTKDIVYYLYDQI